MPNKVSQTPGHKSKGIKFKVGDRVMHKPASMMGSLGGALPPRTKLGTIIAIEYRSNKRGALMPWLQVQWDQSSARPEWTMTMRIALAPDAEAVAKVIENEREKVN